MFGGGNYRMKSSLESARNEGAPISRRRLIKLGLVAGATLAVPGVALADEWVRMEPHQNQPRFVPARLTLMRRPSPAEARTLSMQNVHTGESLNAVYWERGEYLPDALRAVNYFFRDFRANEEKDIDPRLLDLLHGIGLQLDTSKPINLVSGYRTAATNAWLAQRSEGVARHSMHIQGRAADINIPGRQLSILDRVALALRVGGVGYYPHSDFVHVDTGRVRHW
jgi:uncharacterized protein YcbK (DUF882 family)